MILCHIPLKLSKLLLKVSSCFVRTHVLLYYITVSLDCSLGSQDFNLLQNDSSLSLCLNRLPDHDYIYTVHIYTQNGSVSQFRYINTSMEIILQYEINYCMNVTSECCGSTATVENFNFQFKTQNPYPDEIYNISVKFYFDCNLNEFNYLYTQKMCVTSTGKLAT